MENMRMFFRTYAADAQARKFEKCTQLLLTLASVVAVVIDFVK